MRKLMFLALLTFSFTAAGTWKIVTEPFPPYFSPELAHKGWMHDLVITALKSEGIDVEIEYMAWSRAMGLTKSGRAVAALGAYKTAKRELNYFYSMPLGKTDTGFFKKSTLALEHPTNLKTFEGLVIAKGEEYVVVEGLETHPNLSFTRTVDLVTSLFMLLGDRVDLVAGTRQVGEHWLRYHSKLNTHPNAATIEFVLPPIKSQQMYVIFGRSVTENNSRMAQFNGSIKRFVQSGELDKLLVKHDLSDR